MAPTLSAHSALTLRKRYYYYSSSDSMYYKGRIIGIVIGTIVLISLIIWYVMHRNKVNKRKRLATLGPLPYAPGGALSPISLAPPPYSGPPEEAPVWNGSQWQGPKGENGSEGPYWNGLIWCKESGPVWNGITWVNAGPVNGVMVPMNESTGRVWNGSEWVGGWPGQVRQNQAYQSANVGAGQDASTTDWHKRLPEGGVQAPVPAYTPVESRKDGVNADGGLGHVTTQSRDFGALKHNTTATTAAAPEEKEKEKESGFKKFLKITKGGK